MLSVMVRRACLQLNILVYRLATDHRFGAAGLAILADEDHHLVLLAVLERLRGDLACVLVFTGRHLVCDLTALWG